MNLKDRDLNEKQINFLKQFIDDGPSDKEDRPIKDVLLSIKPKYVQKIRTGEKQWEFRKQIWSNNKIIDKIYLYETSPKQRITSYFRTSRVINADPNHIWELCKDQAGISKEEFFTYFNGHDEGYAIKISNFHELKNPIDPYKKFRGFNAPQNFMYITITSNDINKKQNKNNDNLTEQIGFKLSKSLRHKLEQYAAEKNKSVSKIIRELLRDTLNEVKQTDPPKPSDLNPPPEPKEPKKTQKTVTEPYYPKSKLNSKDRKKLNEEIKKGIKLTETNYCEKCNKRYSELECPYCNSKEEEENKEEDK